MKILKNKKGNYLPKHDRDVSLFRHCCDGMLEVKEWKFKEFERVFLVHNVIIEIEDESQNDR